MHIAQLCPWLTDHRYVNWVLDNKYISEHIYSLRFLYAAYRLLCLLIQKNEIEIEKSICKNYHFYILVKCVAHKMDSFKDDMKNSWHKDTENKLTDIDDFYICCTRSLIIVLTEDCFKLFSQRLFKNTKFLELQVDMF